jgi:type VI secretion system protein ImpK
MNDAFAKLVGPTLQFGLSFPQRLAQGEQPSLSEVRTELMEMIDEAGRRAAASRELADDFALARHALVYWIDEVLINSRWAHAGEWRDHILEWDYYRERLGGEKFFEKARDAEVRAGTDPLEVFFLCVSLGFQGRYAFSRPELQAWSARAYRRIVQGNPPPDRFLPDDPGDDEILRPLPGKSVLLTVSVLVSITALATLACFIMAVHMTG